METIEGGAGRRTFLSRLRESSKWKPYLLILLAALVASAVRIVRGISCGHDFDFHLDSWMEAQRDWSQGVVYPHWAQMPNWGAGEPRFVFYPPLSWMLGAVLGYVFGWDWTPFALTLLCLAGAGLTTRMLARQFLPEATATLAGVLAASTPYGLFVAYERSAYSELMAAVFIPLLLLVALQEEQESRPETKRAVFAYPVAIQTALLLAAIWLTNAPSGVMATYLLVFATLVVSWLRRKRISMWIPIMRTAIGTAVGLGLAAIYLVPAAWEQRWIAIDQALDVGMRVQDSWLFARHASADLELHDQVLLAASILFTLTATMAGVGIFLSWRSGKLAARERNFWIPLGLLIPLIFLLQLPISWPVWMLPEMRFLQFPWRWLMVLGIPYAIFCAAATPLFDKKERRISTAFWAGVLVLFSFVACVSFYQACDEEDQVGNQKTIFRDGSGTDGTDEYAPAGADNSLVASGLPDGCLVSDATEQLGEGDPNASPDWYPEQGSCDDTYTAQLWQAEHKVLQIDSDHEGYVVLRLRRYPAWQITVNGKAAPQVDGKPAFPGVPLRDDGLIAVPVSSGISTIDVRWKATPDDWVGRWISIVSLVALICLLGAWGMGRRGIVETA